VSHMTDRTKLFGRTKLFDRTKPLGSKEEPNRSRKRFPTGSSKGSTRLESLRDQLFRRSLLFRIAGIAESRSSTIFESRSMNSLSARLISSPNAAAASTSVALLTVNPPDPSSKM
jgi:hypothetical protein